MCNFANYLLTHFIDFDCWSQTVCCLNSWASGDLNFPKGMNKVSTYLSIYELDRVMRFLDAVTGMHEWMTQGCSIQYRDQWGGEEDVWMSLVYPHVSPRWDPPCPGDGGSAAGVPSLHRLCLSEWGEGRCTESLRPLLRILLVIWHIVGSDRAAVVIKI